MTTTAPLPALGYIVKTTATIELPFQTILTEDQGLEIAKNWGDPEDGIAYTQGEIEEAIAAHFEYEATDLAAAALSTVEIVDGPDSVSWRVAQPEFNSEGVELQPITRTTELG